MSLLPARRSTLKFQKRNGRRGTRILPSLMVLALLVKMLDEHDVAVCIASL